MNIIIIDSCFWFALYNPRDQYHSQAYNMWDDINTNTDKYKLIIPYPTLYETINTKFSSDTISMKKFMKILKDPIPVPIN
jgi:predicted nucleic acid-binding protein